MEESLGSIAYAFSALGVSLVALYGFLRWVEFRRGQLLSDTRVDELQRSFHSLETRTRQSIEQITKKVDESVVKIENRVEAQEMKMGMNSPLSNPRGW